jgi:hypothetical protein
MGNDERVITKYLDRHYKVVIHGIASFTIVDLETEEKYTINKLETDIFDVIFGEYIMASGISSRVFLDNWFIEKKRQLVARLMDYVIAMDFKKGSLTLFEELKLEFDNDKEYDREMISIIFNEYYAQKVTLAKAKKFLSELKIRLGERNWLVIWKGKTITSENIHTLFSVETAFQHNLVRRMFEVWYTEARLKGTEKEINTY